MKHIVNCGSGLHPREVKCAQILNEKLPSGWYGYSNLDLVLGRGNTREVDLVIISDHYIFVIDVKDWYGKIESLNGNWIQNGQDRGASPVKKIVEIQRKIYEKLQGQMKSRKETRNLPVPKVHGLVLMSGEADYSSISEMEASGIFDLNHFVRIANGKGKLRENFGNVSTEHVRATLSGKPWKQILTQFFNVNSGSVFEAGRQRFQGLIAGSAPSFIHPGEIYSEFDAHEEKIPRNTATLRLWDFAKCTDARFQTEEGRLEIAGRERSIFHWLRDRNSFAEKYLLTPTSHDFENSINYWEAYERRPAQKRLSDFVLTELSRLTAEERIELCRQLIAALSSFHDCGAAHLDLGEHSIWLEAPTTVRLSHLLAAHVPKEKSLGIDRYQFLASVTLPETVLDISSSAQQKDVFLVGVAVHTLLFGSAPHGSPPDWDSSVDSGGSYESLHPWFEVILEHDPSNRFQSCSDALSLFNKVTSVSPTSAEVIKKLEDNFSNIKSQMQAARSFPVSGEMLNDTNLIEAWISQKGDEKILVKIWKQAAFGDLRTNASKILSFLERAKSFATDQPRGVAIVKEFSWLSDAIIITQKWTEGTSWQDYCELYAKNRNLEAISALGVVKNLVSTIIELHDQKISHGDLKPSNVIVGVKNEVTLIDILDFSLDLNGGNSVSSYAPSAGGNFERDRFAVTRMTIDIFEVVSNPSSTLEELKNRAIASTGKQQSVATLDPLLDSINGEIQRLTNPEASDPDEKLISISIRSAEKGFIDPDEGKFYFRHRNAKDIQFLHMRGACEELMIALSPDWKIQWVKRQDVTQSNIIRNSKIEIANCTLNLNVEGNSTDNFLSLEALIEELEIKHTVEGRQSIIRELHPDRNGGSSEADDDLLAEEIYREKNRATEVSDPVQNDLDIPLLWRKLIEVEDDQSIEGQATEDGFFDNRLRLYCIPFELQIGQMDFAREDKVTVEKEARPFSDKWVKVGQLDVRQSRNDMIFVDSYFEKNHLRIDDQTKLRFESFFTSESLRRRKNAVDRVLGGSGRTADLLSAFDPRTKFLPREIISDIDEKAIAAYGLNEEQENALRGVVTKRPLGLVQGPPGTGKTRLIAALTHYALTHGLARNVLLSSQSHEAVNTAIEGVLRLFSKEGKKPSVFRAGANLIGGSADLQQYFSLNLEQSLKDRFVASFRDRMRIAGKTLGIPDRIVDMISTIETTISDIAQSLVKELRSRSGQENERSQKVNSLRNTLQRQIDTILPNKLDISEYTEFEDVPDRIVTILLSTESRPIGLGDDKIQKLREIARLGKDLAGSSSSAARSFEPFFAGTREIVAGTCVGLGRRALGLTETSFDLVIIDEAARCTPSELLVPLQASRWTVLVGDQAQLQPHHEAKIIETVAREMKVELSDIVKSDFERVFQSDYARTSSFSMRRQYRMLPKINQIVARTFYKGLNLSSGRAEPIVPIDVLQETLENEVTWIETDKIGIAAFEQTPVGGASKINEVEADAIVGLLEKWVKKPSFLAWLESQEEYENGVGVICMYAAQRDLVRRKLNIKGIGKYLDKGIKVGTVDSYQGKENPFVILSLVRNNRDGAVVNSMKSIKEGFLATPNRVNVAMSRAMDRLVIVGNRKFWRPGTPLADISFEFSQLASEGQASIVHASELLDIDLENPSARIGKEK
jgi:serine/threonine protein kinase